jgi:ABC-type bacteriocin/lantibiotic exporter with double-glycine peptidase domain
MKTHPQYEPWLQGMLIIAKHYRLDFSAEHVRVTINHESQSPRQLVLEEMARQLGLGMRVVAAEAVSRSVAFTAAGGIHRRTNRSDYPHGQRRQRQPAV